MEKQEVLDRDHDGDDQSAAYFLTRSSLETFEVSIRYHLGLVSQESTMLYKEIDG